jgi:hypothetical protein
VWKDVTSELYEEEMEQREDIILKWVIHFSFWISCFMQQI